MSNVSIIAAEQRDASFGPLVPRCRHAHIAALTSGLNEFVTPHHSGTTISAEGEPRHLPVVRRLPAASR